MEAKQEDSDSNSALFDSLRFTKELDDRQVTESDVELVSYSYLLSAYLMLNGSKTAAMDRSTVYLNCKNILSRAVSTLPMSGDHYLVVFKLIHDLCVGEMSLTQDDISVLSKHVQWTPKKDDKEEDQETTPTELVAPSPGQESVSVAGEEVAKLFNQLKSRKPLEVSAPPSAPVTPTPSAYPQGKPMLAMIRKKLKAKKKSKLLKDSNAPTSLKVRSLFKAGGDRTATPQGWSSAPALAGESELSASVLCREIVEELGVGASLVQFCKSLPVIKELSCSYSNGDMATFWLGAVGPAGEGGEIKLAILIDKLQQLRNVSEALSLLLHTPNLLPPLSASSVADLKELLVACVKGAAEAIVLCTSLPTKTRESSASAREEATPVAETVAETVPDFEKDGESEAVATSILDLYSSLSGANAHLSCSSTSARTLASAAVALVLKSYQRVLCLPLSSSVHRNLRTLYIIHTFTSLRPLLLPVRAAGKVVESGEVAGLTKPQGGANARLSVPLAEMMIHAVEGIKSLCEDVTVVGTSSSAIVATGDGTKGAESEGDTMLTLQNLDVCRTYSSYVCVEMIMSYVPLLQHLFSLIVAAFKKIQTHVGSVASQVASEESSTQQQQQQQQQQTPAKGAEAGPGEKHSQLKATLLEKLSERLAAADKMAAAEKQLTGEENKDLEEERETYSPSPVSTVSSSGEQGGVYMLYSDATHSEDEEQEGSDEVDEYVESPPFFMASLGRSFGATPTTTAATSAPPLPPRRVPPKELQVKTTSKQTGGGESKKKKPMLLLRLASSSLQCLFQGLVKNPNLNKYVRDKINTEHVSSIALLVQNMDAVMAKVGVAGSKLGSPFCSLLTNFSSELMELLQEMIVTGVINRQYLQGVLLNELGLTPKCWPLKIPPAVLSILGSVLICRLGEGPVNGDRDEKGAGSAAKDESLAVSIWKGFLYSLEESACSDEEPDEDLDVVHLQLLLFVWHTFSLNTRSSLLSKCAQAVIKSAQAVRDGVSVSPLINSRLLMVLDYLLYQFTDAPPDLTSQIKTNLFQDFTLLGSRPASRSTATPTNGSTTRGTQKTIVCYSNEIQLKYCTVLSKPNTTAVPSTSKDVAAPAKDVHEEMGVSPRFYNVRKCVVPSEKEKKEEGDEEEAVQEGGVAEAEAEIDDQACRCLLSLSIPEGVDDVTQRGSGYSLLVDALLTLMGVGSDYSNSSKPLPERVLLACSAHQCFTIAVALLGSLPPSYNTILAMVDGKGLSVVDKKGACLLIHVLHLCMKFRVDHMDTEDIMDTLLLSGNNQEESEELMARIISVLDSTDHFKDQATSVLRELSENDSDVQLPLVCIAAVDLLLCLVTRSVYLDVGDESESAESVPKEEEEDAGEQYAKGTTLDKFEVTFCTQLGPVIIKVLYRLLACAHLYVCPTLPTPDGGESIAFPMREALETLLCLSGKNPLSPKDRPTLSGHLPGSIQERVKSWESALHLDTALKKKLSVYGDISIEACLLKFLDCHLLAFAGSRTFDPSRGLKSAISAVLVVLEYMFGVFHEMEKEGEERKKEVVEAVVSLSCDVTMEFCQAQLLKFLTDNAEFASRCLHYKTARCLQALVIPEMKSCGLAGPILAFLFQLLTSLLLDSPEEDDTLKRVQVMDEPTGLNNLLLMTSLPSMSSEALTEGLQFLIGAMAQADKKSPVAVSEESAVKKFEPYEFVSLALLSMPEGHLRDWLARVVLGSSTDDSATVRHNTGLLRKFVEILTKEAGSGDSPVCHTLLKSLLSLNSDLCSIFLSIDCHTYQHSFRNYFDCLVLLASANKTDGHLLLTRVVVEWLPLVVQAHFSLVDSQVKQTKESKTPAKEGKGSKEGKSADGKSSKKSKDGDSTAAAVDTTENDELTNPLNTLYVYLSHLTTAVQYCGSKTDYVDRRALAAEGDVLFDEDEDDEEVGLTNEDDAAQEEGDEDLNSKTCTFKITHREFANQHWYHCHTCSLVNHSGVCSVCAKVCHKGHDVTYSKFGSFFCDCGAKEDGNCKAMEKRLGDVAGDLMGTSQPPPFSDPPSSQGGRKKKRGKQRRSGKKSPAKEEEKKETSKGSKKEKKKKRLSSPSQSVLRLVQSIEGYASELKEFLVSCLLSDQSVRLLKMTLPRVVQSLASETSIGCNQARNAMTVLHQADKKIEFTDGLMAATLGSQEGAFENVRLNFNENQGPMMRQLLQGYSIIRVAMCALTSVKGKRQHLCVNHDKGKLTILQLFPILKQADSNRRKLTLTRLSTTSVPFTVLSMTHNPCNEDLLVVCGLTECQLLVINTSGQVTSRSLLHPSVGGTGYIVKAIWVPGSKHELVLVTDTFVKVYDTNVDVISPTYYFVLGEGKIKDATVAVTEEGTFVVVMTYLSGKIYSQPLVASVSANEGPVYFTVELTGQHKSIKAGSDGSINGGGASVYYSQTLKMLFFSYVNGITCVATTNSDLSEMVKVFDIYLKSSPPVIPGSKNTGPSLISWVEVQHHPGLVCAVSKLTSNPVTLLVKPEVIQVHELKPLPNKAKVQGMVAMRQPPNIGDSALRRTTLIILCEDGSLRIYVANSTASTEYWLQPKFQPTSPLAVLRSRPLGKGQLVARKKESLKFPIDFFEHCQMCNNIEFGGNDILHVYNKQQVINRLDKANLYIANTKPGGFTVEVTNLASGTVMVGTRILLRSHSPEKSPSSVEVFGRTHVVNVLSGASRWIDIPFTREESIQAGKTFKINFGPSLDQSGVSFVDTIRVYGKSKESFGWPEHPPEPASTKTARDSTSPTDMVDQGSEVLPMVINKGCTAADNLAMNLMTVLSNHFLTASKDKGGQKGKLRELLPSGTSLLMHGVPSQLQFMFKLLLNSLAADKHLYYLDRDKLQLQHVVDALVDHPPDEGNLEPELFQYLLLILVSVCKARPANLKLLSTLISGEVTRALLGSYDTEKKEGELSDVDHMKAIIHLLNAHFWVILKKRPHNPAVTPVVNPGFAAVDLTVACMTEIMWSLVLLDHSLMGVVLQYTIKYLLAPDSHLCLACSRVIMRLLKPKKPQKKEQVVVVGKSVKDASSEAATTPAALRDEDDDDDEEDDEDNEKATEEASSEDVLQPPDVSEEGAEAEEESQPSSEAPEPAPQPSSSQAGEQQPGGGGPQWNLVQQMLGGAAAAAGGGAGGGVAAMLPEQLLALGGMMPDEEAMMNLAIALSLGNEGESAGGSNSGAGGGAGGQMPEQGLQSYLQNLMGELLPQANEGGAGGGGGGRVVEDRASSQANEGEEDGRYEPVEHYEHANEPFVAADSSYGPSENVENAPPLPVVPAAEEVNHHSRSSSPSSLYSLPHEEDPRLMSQLEGVLREETATPSETRREPDEAGRSGQGKESGRNQTDGEPVKDGKGAAEEDDDELQNDNSEPEMVNDSSAEEDDLGEDEKTLVETLCQNMEQSRVVEVAEGGSVQDAANMRLAELRKLLLRQLLENLEMVEEAGGMRAISYLQLLIFLTTNLECCKEDCEELVQCLRVLLGRMNLLKEGPEPDSATSKGLVERTRRREVFLLYFRFFNILMSRQKIKPEDSKAYNKHMQWFLTARTLLEHSHIMLFSRLTLTSIMELPSCLEMAELPGGSSSSAFINPLDNLSPFFQKHYVKGHMADIFSTYGRLLAEILLVLPCQLKKIGDVTSGRLPSPVFGHVWEETLCDFLLKISQNTGVGRRHVRKLLLQICGSRENYRYTRDLHSLGRYIGVIIDTCKKAGFNPEKVMTSAPLNLGYKAMLGLIEQLRLCAEVVAIRTNNWQIYCHKEKSTLPYLFQTLFVLDSGLAPLIIQLIHAALSGMPPVKADDPIPEPEVRMSRRKKDMEALRAKEKEKSKTKESKVSVVVPDKEQCRALVQLFLSVVDSQSLARFSELFLLQSNSSPLRWQAHKLIHTLYQYASDAQRVSIVEMLWDLWSGMPNHGHKAAQFVDLLGYLTISTPQVLEKESLCQLYVERAVSLLKKQNLALSSHPNAHIYSQLRSLVDFDGFYLESEPCLVCNDPEVQSSMMKLHSIKSEIKYTPNMILAKLTGSHSISQIQIRISDIKRTKMVKTVNVYYSNRTVANVIELKNKRSLWLMAKTCNLTAGQNEVKVDFPLPIVASNIIVQFSDFYDNLQGGSEVLQCPRCQASVPAHPGVCNTCGENVYQCHKCRAINYDEKDPFLCNSCGFSKYAKFDTYIEGKSCSAVDPIESEEDRQKTMSSINQLLEKADKFYRQQVGHRNELDQLLVCLASGTQFHYRTRGPMGSDLGVNKGIQVVAQQYCVECKTIYSELSKIIQNVMASRRELVKYDTHKGEGLGSSVSVGSPVLSPSPMASHPGVVTSPPPTPLLSGGGALPVHHQGRCYGCSSAATEHCITLLKALTFQTNTRRPLVMEKLIRELVEVNLRAGSAHMQRDIRRLLCQLTRDDVNATNELNDLLYYRITTHLNAPRIDPNLASIVRPEMLLLMVSLDMEDSCWEQRLRTVFRLFRRSQAFTNPAVMAGITMPCLKIMNGLVYPKDAKKQKNNRPIPLGNFSDRITVQVKEWVCESPDASFNKWREDSRKKEIDISSRTKEEIHCYRLMEKYAGRWKLRTKKLLQFKSCIRQASWLRSMLFNPASQSARRSTCTMIASLCQGDARQRQILDLLCGFLDDVGSAGEYAQEFLELLKLLTEDSKGQWKLYLSMRGVLPKIGALITREIDHLKHLEESTLSSDLSQGYALKMLTALLQSFLSIDHIKQLFKSQMVGIVLNGYLSLKRLVVQRTKRVDESQDLLLEMLEDLTSGTEEEKQSFMKSCVETLNQFSDSDLITPIFVFERLCNIIHPEDNDVGEFFLTLDKDPQQEEFLQGRMQGNPYPSTSAGLGPLMRDVKNKICTDCELVALLEDDTGMELLVRNKIISLDLPVKDVYKKIWCAQENHGDIMRVIYRMRGLLGDATEDIVEQLDDGKDKDTNEEEEYKMADIMGKCGGLDAVLARLSRVRDFVQGHAFISAALRLLGYCVKLKANRDYLLRPELNTLNVLLRTLDLALHYEELTSNGIGASVAESVLRVTERILQEASRSQQVLVRTTSQEGSPLSPQEPDSDGDLQVFLRHIERGFVQSNPTLREGLMHIIPFLTFGVTRHMNVLLQHFAPYLNFDKFDSEGSSENRLYLDCFCVVAEGIGRDASGEKMKDLAIEMNITPSAVDYLIQKVPEKSPFDTSEWKDFIAQPSVPYVLKMLTGLCHWHSKTQTALLPAIGKLHLLEQIASDQHIGTLAENLLEAMIENAQCKEEIKRVRRETRQEKKKKAMAMRAKELESFRMQVNEKGQVKVSLPSELVKEMEAALVDEAGLKCCICLEGYKNQPKKVLGIYTYTRKVTLDEFESKPKKTKGYATVSHFNVVHYDCHAASVSSARSRDEWESAMLHNANTKCNGLLPVWGLEVTETNFNGCLSRHNTYLQDCTGLYDHSHRIFLHDLRLLLLRFAYEKSFSAESGGGGPQSNLYLVPYMVHVIAYLITINRREEKSLDSFLAAGRDKWVASAYELDGPQYCLVESLVSQTLSQWRATRLTFLQRLIVLAHARSLSSAPIKSLPSTEPAEFPVYKPLLIMFGLVDGLHSLLKSNLDASAPDITTAVLEYIRTHDEAVLQGCDKLVTLYQDKLLKLASFQEFSDLLEIEEAGQSNFIAELFSSL